MPAWAAGNSGAVSVGRLVTRRALEAGHAVTIRPANDIIEMAMPIVTLLWIVGRGVAVETAWMGEDRIHLSKGVESGLSASNRARSGRPPRGTEKASSRAKPEQQCQPMIESH
jgi:hypothetical protein